MLSYEDAILLYLANFPEAFLPQWLIVARCEGCEIPLIPPNGLVCGYPNKGVFAGDKLEH